MAMAKRANGEGSIFRRGKGKRYWISWKDENGVRQQRSSGTTDRRVAERLLREETERVHAIRKGLIDLRAEAMAEAGRGPIGDILNLFMAKLREAGRSERHTSAVESHLRRFVKRSEITTLAEITSESVLAEADRMRKAGRSARTRQHVIGNIKALTRWAWREGMSPVDPLAGLSLPNPDTDRRRRRRMLTVEEWHRLESAAINGPDRYGLSGPVRAMVYATAIQTGLRANELRQLRRSSLHLDGERPFVVVEAGGTKNRTVARQYIRPELAERLRIHAAMMSPGAAVFALPDRRGLPAMLRADLEAARAAWLAEAAHDPVEAARRAESDFLAVEDHDGRVVDFHALRHTCGAWATMAGASLQAVKALMRHSTITLTADTYGHLAKGEEAETVARLPGFDRPDRLAQTGTAGCSNRVSNGGAGERNSVRSGAIRKEHASNRGSLKITGETAILGENEAERGGFEPPWTRRPNRISNPAHSTALPPLQAGTAPDAGSTIGVQRGASQARSAWPRVAPGSFA